VITSTRRARLSSAPASSMSASVLTRAFPDPGIAASWAA
jgi:hypothetical protein